MEWIRFYSRVFQDPRWFKLLESCPDHEKAIGKLVLFWLQGANNWKSGSEVIPNDSISKSIEPVIDAGFGERKEDGVYVKGSRELLSWMKQRSDAGKHSAQRPRDSKGRLLPNEHPTKVQRESNEKLTTTQENPTLSSHIILSSYLSSSLEEEESEKKEIQELIPVLAPKPDWLILFDHYRTVFHKSARYTPDTHSQRFKKTRELMCRQAIEKRGLDESKEAVNAFFRETLKPSQNGYDPSKYDDIGYLFGTDERIDKWAEEGLRGQKNNALAKGFEAEAKHKELGEAALQLLENS
jgi:hypothetical protein